jgi:hypothetical protein
LKETPDIVARVDELPTLHAPLLDAGRREADREARRAMAGDTAERRAVPVPASRAKM